MHQNASFFRRYCMDHFEPSKELRQGILRTIAREELQRAKNYLLISLATASVSIVGTVFAIIYAAQSLYQSSFYQYSSLLFSDADIVLSYWREFALTLAESLPFLAITLVLVAIVTFMVSLRLFTNNVQPYRKLSFSN